MEKKRVNHVIHVTIASLWMRFHLREMFVNADMIMIYMVMI